MTEQRNGVCDVCGREGILSTSYPTGIETHACSLCTGDDTLHMVCPDCKGTGWVDTSVTARGAGGQPITAQTGHGCTTCDGFGELWVVP